MAVTAQSQADDKKEFSEGVSFWDRLTAGNIDEPGSKAYKLWNKSPEAVAEREAEAMKSGANKAAEDGIAAGKAVDAKPVMAAAPNDVKAAHEAAEAERLQQFKEGFDKDWEATTDLASKPIESPVAPVATKPAVRKPVAKPAAPAVDPVASTLKAAPVAKPTAVDEIHAAATESAARDQASKIKLPATQPATLKQKFAADNANIKGVLIDGQPAMRPDATPAPRAKFYGSEFK